MKFAIKIRYLEKDKWHQHTTKWYKNSEDAWEEKEAYELKYGYYWLESASSLMHKEI